MPSIINASTSGAGGVITTADASGELRLQTAATTAVTIDASQNVGIGATSITDKLEVVGATTAGDKVISSFWQADTTANSSSSIWLSSGTGGNSGSGRGTKISAITNGNGAGNGHSLAFATSANGASPTERMRISSAGVITSGLGGMQVISGTAVSATGTSIDFTGIPSWVKRITVIFRDVSLSGSSNIQIQLGDSGGIETTGYVGGGWTNNVIATSTSGAPISGGYIASWAYSGTATILNISSNDWVFSSCGAASNNGNPTLGGSSKTLSATLDRIRITTVNGTDTFDAGSINILYE
jgi:hypothetical protein